MDRLDQDKLALWKRELAEVQHLLAVHGPGSAPRRLRPGEIAYLDEEARRLAALITATDTGGDKLSRD